VSAISSGFEFLELTAEDANAAIARSSGTELDGRRMQRRFLWSGGLDECSGVLQSRFTGMALAGRRLQRRNCRRIL
jgi:hypothetical protein